jgi:hypothetical protein
MLLEKPERGQPILLTIGERVVQLIYPLGEAKELDREHGISVLKSNFGELVESTEKQAVCLYYGLRSKQPDITPEWVDKNVDATMLVWMWPYMVYAMKGIWPYQMARKIAQADTGEEDAAAPPNFQPPPTPRLSTGLPSGPSGDTTLVSVNSISGG